jgi:hypothetical protein
MHHYTQNSDYRNNSYLPPLSSTSSRNNYYQYYDPRLRTQHTPYSDITSIPTYESPSFHHQYKPSRNISDLSEPISVFDDLKPPRHNTTIFPLIYLPPNPSRRSSVSDARLATASAIRERLLTDIQQNITEIDREITSLEQRYSSPQRFSSFAQSRQSSFHQNTVLSNDKNQMWPNKHKRVYQVIPRITSESKKTSQQSTPKLAIDQTSSQLFIGQFHYGAEVEENEILDNDPENSDRRSIVHEIPEFSSRKTFSLGEFIREQSDLSQNRALTLVPEYVDNIKTETNQLTEDMHQNNPIVTNTTRSSTASSLHDFASSNKLNAQDFQSMGRTVPQTKVQITSKNGGNPHKSTEKIEPGVMNTMVSKPVKHSDLSTKTRQTLSVSQQAISHSVSNSTDDIGHFFSDYGDDGEGEEDVMTIDPNHFTLPTEAEMISDDNTSVRHSQISLLNPHSSQHQQLAIENNNAHVKERESKKIDATTKHIAATTSTSASKKILPISISDNMRTQFARNNNNNTEDQRQISPTISNMNMNENTNSSDRRSISVNREYNPTPQQSSSSRRSSKSSSVDILYRDQSISSADIRKASANESEHSIDDDQH